MRLGAKDDLGPPLTPGLERLVVIGRAYITGPQPEAVRFRIELDAVVLGARVIADELELLRQGGKVELDFLAAELEVGRLDHAHVQLVVGTKTHGLPFWAQSRRAVMSDYR